LLLQSGSQKSCDAQVRCGKHKPYQVIITNVNLPILNGYYLGQRLNNLKQKHREALKGFSDVKIVAIADEASLSNQDSFDYVLTKPLDQNKVREMLNKFGMLIEEHQ